MIWLQSIWSFLNFLQIDFYFECNKHEIINCLAYFLDLFFATN